MLLTIAVPMLAFVVACAPTSTLTAGIKEPKSTTTQERTEPNYIIKLSGESVYIDAGRSQGVFEGMEIPVTEPGEEIIHPVTGKVYREPPKEIARLKVKRIEDDICIAQVTSTEAMSLLKVGQEIDIAAAISQTRYSLAVLDFYISSLKSCIYGNYVADIVVQELSRYKTFRLYERERLNAILSEQQLGVSGLVDSQTAAQLGKVIGVRYVLFGRVPVFEARESKSRVPLHGLARVGEIVTGKQMGSGLVSDIEIKQMVAKVKLAGRIVDVETGEILCICDGKGNAEGEENVRFIHGVFGGMKQDSGPFRDSILGEATERASAMLAGKVAQKFNPQIRIKNKKK